MWEEEHNGQKLFLIFTPQDKSDLLSAYDIPLL